MKPLQTLQLKASEIRKKLGELGAIESPTDEQRTEIGMLTTEYQTLETRQQALIVAGDNPENPGEGEQVIDQPTENGDKLIDLETRSSIGDVFTAALDGRDPDGATRELQAELNLAGNQVPLALLRPAMERRGGGPGNLETRAITPAPANVGQNQSTIIQGVFPSSVAAFLHVDMPTVDVGDQVYPVLTKNAEVKAPAESADADETTGSFSAEILSPARLQASFFYSREDRAKFAGMDMSLRDNLNAALSDGLDKRIVAGDDNGFLHGTNLANHNAAAITDFGDYKSDFAYSRVDGIYASNVGDIRVVMGSATFAHAATKYRANNSDDSGLDVLMQRTAGVRVSAHVPAVAANKQNSIIRLGSRRDAVAPIWEGVTLIPDEITAAKKGHIIVTAVMLYAFQIVRTAGFYKQQSQHA